MTEAELQLVLSTGEGYRTEFKENLSSIDKEMCALANGSGGFIFVGISDTKEVKGVEVSNKLTSQVQDIARNCDPPIKIILEEYKNILIVDVREGDDKPYRCTSGFYNRTGPNSQKMNRDEIIEFVKAEGKVKFDELVNRSFTDTDFDQEKLSRFLKIAGISSVMDTPAVIHRDYFEKGAGERRWRG